MRKGKLRRRILSVVMSVTMAACIWTAPEMVVKAETSTQGQLPFRVLRADEMVAEMGAGWNLGNTMDGHTGFTPNETLWQNVETTQGLIDAVHDYGFNTVRVPITWGTMIDDENNYAINDMWMSRVQDIVDYCVNQDMYVIINIHHDGAEQSGWLRVAAEDQEPVKEKFAAVWKQIAERFKDYDEHVIFESMNEVTGDASTNVNIDTERIMALNQIFVDTVRATGSNNAERWLSVPGRYTNIENTTKESVGFDIPTDKVEDRIFVAVHYYDWTFGLLESMGQTSWGLQLSQTLQRDFVKLYDRFTSQGIPVILGEYGAINKNNPEERAYHVECVNRLCQMYGVVPVYWDQGWYDRSMNPDYSFTLIDRETFELVDGIVTEAAMRGLFIEAASEDLSDIEKAPAVNGITDVTYSADSATLSVGETLKIDVTLSPADTNDILLWSTDDTDVATVYNGMIRAKGIGVTTVRAYSLSGSYSKEITVIVKPAASDVPCTDIAVQDSYTLETGKYTFLNATMAPENTDAHFTYQSSNEEVATVSTTGKVLAIAPGVTYVTITASTGISKVVKVTVMEPQEAAALRLALNVYYNDSALGYYSNEVGTPITVEGEGQYTVTFNCETDLSQKAKDAGVTGLLNLTAIYIKDQDVTEGLAKKTPLSSCNIMYDEILINGKALTITQEAPKSALKASGILDTNDPFNSWDGSQVKEVNVDTSTHVLNVGSDGTPTEVTVTFTLSDMIFSTGDATASQTINVDSMTADVTEVTVAAGEAVDVSVTVAPNDASAPITFASSDAAVASVDSTAVISDATTGVANISVYGVSEGTTEITAYAENGKTVKIAVTVEGEAVEETPKEPEVPAEPVTPSEPEEPSDAPATTPDTEGPVVEADKDQADAPKKGLSTVAIVAIVIGVVVVIGTVVYVVISLKPAKGTKKEETKTEEAKEE